MTTLRITWCLQGVLHDIYTEYYMRTTQNYMINTHIIM